MAMCWTCSSGEQAPAVWLLGPYPQNGKLRSRAMLPSQGGREDRDHGRAPPERPTIPGMFARVTVQVPTCEVGEGGKKGRVWKIDCVGRSDAVDLTARLCTAVRTEIVLQGPGMSPLSAHRGGERDPQDPR